MSDNAADQSIEVLPDLNSCANEPIQFAGAIEPHGFLLVLSTPALQILQASANTLLHLGFSAEDLLGMRLCDIVAQEDAARLTSGAFKEGKRRYVGGVLLNSQGLVDALVHKCQDLLIIELEPHSSAAKIRSDSELYASLTGALAELDGQLGLVDLCQRVVIHIRLVTGFDRVILYRFLKDDSGSVVAEERRADLTPFLGLRFPASDIPAQARRLYLLNTLRLKPDVNAQRVAITPALNPYTGAALDMSFCILRAMSPVHDEYLRNMGVSSSMSISIIKEGKLWGLVVCHHTQPMLVPHPTRITCEVLARVFSCSIAAAEDEDDRFRSAAVSGLTQQITGLLRNDRDIAGALNHHAAQINSAMRADGVAFYFRGKLSLVGLTPTSERIQSLLAWLTVTQQEHVFSTQQLTSDHPEAAAIVDHASGLFSLRIALGGPDFIVWFRPAIAKVIDWAGNPEKPVEATSTGQRISPRRSFELWKQTVRDSSEPWDEIDLQFARSIRHSVAEALLLQLNEEASRLNVELSRSNLELNSFAYAASHDLQEPLRTISMYTQLIVRRASQDFTPQIREFLSVIESNAARMGSMITSLLSYSEVGGTERYERKLVNSEDVLSETLMNLHEPLVQSGATVTHDPLPLVSADHGLMVQVLQNLIGNAIKYRRKNEPPHIHLSASRLPAVEKDNVGNGSVGKINKEWLFSVRDNGQGFAPEYAELIFVAFKRLHGREIPGNGIGLATCKRIVELNGGRIWAESGGPDCGATFSFTLPCVDGEHESSVKSPTTSGWSVTD